MSSPARVTVAPRAPEPVLMVGSVAFDNIETPTQKGERILGGSAAFASLAASYFAPVRMVGVVGHDFPEAFIERLRARGVDLEGLQIDRTGQTFFWAGRYGANFNERVTLDIQLNVFERFAPQLPPAYQDSRFVLLGNIQPTLQEHVRHDLRPGAFVAADTIDLWIKVARADLVRLLGQIDLFFLNESEAELLTGESNLVTAGRRLLDFGLKYAVVKKGSHGVFLVHPGGLFALPAYPVTNLQDPTGAGDSFAGAFMGFLAAHGEVTLPLLQRALLYGTAVASLTVESFSCDRLEAAGPAEIEARVAELRAMTQLA